MPTTKKDSFLYGENYIRIFFSDSQDYGDFHYIWLRHNCLCFKGCLHPKTKERINDSSEIPFDILPRTVIKYEDADQFIMEWEDGHISTYKYSFLQEHNYALNRRFTQITNNSTKLAIDFQEFIKLYPNDDGKLSNEGRLVYRQAVAQKLKAHGIVLIRNSNEKVTNDDLDASIEHKLPSTRPFIDVGADLTKASTYPNTPPDIHILLPHSDTTTEEKHFFVDGIQAATYLRRKDRRIIDLLASVTVKFRELNQVTNAPIIELTSDSRTQDDYLNITKVRNPKFELVPVGIPFSCMEEWYYAYNCFNDFLHDPRNGLELTLKKTDLILFNSSRVLYNGIIVKGHRHP
ncbi:hypothetical protein K7432_005915 [Basidiobolus ranarum]|uniref:trimethyllysine dioxygenase n=1 Tax=Basidiobolus ranarum TaxID=34480 RepID=A0ABR2W2N1_9FUNG